jgi:citrate lyase subunit beta/citryl-CoA lyase
MMSLVKPIRTWLFAPGMDARKCEKAVQSSADALILDLEDAVALSEKPKARLMLSQLVKSVSPERQVYVRVNDFMTGMTAEDLRAVCTGGIAGIVLPKAESAEMVRIASAMIDELSRAEGLPHGQITMCGILETARGVLRAEEIAAGGGRLSTLMFGAGDFTGDLGIPTSNVGPHVVNAKIQTALACRAAGIRPLTAIRKIWAVRKTAGLPQHVKNLLEWRRARQVNLLRPRLPRHLYDLRGGGPPND